MFKACAELGGYEEADEVDMFDTMPYYDVNNILVCMFNRTKAIDIYISCVH
jgi:hypothetical protein